MRSTRVMIAVAVLASTQGALGQDITIAVTHDNAGPVVAMGQTVNWQLAVELEGFEIITGDPVIESVNIRLDPTDSGFASYGNFQYEIDPNGGTDGGAWAGGVIEIGFTNSVFLEMAGAGAAERSNPLVIASWTTTVQDMGPFGYALSLGPSTSALVSVATSPFSSIDFYQPDVNFQSDMLFVPAPSAALLLAPACLALGRRRRA